MGRIRDDRCSFVCGLQECGGDIEYKPNRFAIAAVDLGDVRTLQQFQVSISQRRIQLLPSPGIVQATLREYYDSIQHVGELASCRIPRAFAFNNHTEPIILRLSCQSEPLQLIEQGGELGRTESAGSLCAKGLAEIGVLPDDGKYGRTR